MWVGLKRKKSDVLPRKREFCLQMAFRLELQHRLFPGPPVSNLSAHPADFELDSFHNHMTQFLYILLILFLWKTQTDTRVNLTPFIHSFIHSIQPHSRPFTGWPLLIATPFSSHFQFPEIKTFVKIK